MELDKMSSVVVNRDKRRATARYFDVYNVQAGIGATPIKTGSARSGSSEKYLAERSMAAANDQLYGLDRGESGSDSRAGRCRATSRPKTEGK